MKWTPNIKEKYKQVLEFFKTFIIKACTYVLHLSYVMYHFFVDRESSVSKSKKIQKFSKPKSEEGQSFSESVQDNESNGNLPGKTFMKVVVYSSSFSVT